MTVRTAMFQTLCGFKDYGEHRTTDEGRRWMASVHISSCELNRKSVIIKLDLSVFCISKYNHSSSPL